VKKVLTNLPNRYRDNLHILTCAFDVFIKCNDLSSAEKIFSKVGNNTLSYGNLMTAYNKNNQPAKTINLYKQMKSVGIEPDSIVSLVVINACAALGIFSISQLISEQIPKSFIQNSYIKNALIDMWVRIEFS